MLLANYGSDSEPESDTEAPIPSTSRLIAPLQKTAANPSSSFSKPKKRGPVKITLEQPKPSTTDDDPAEIDGRNDHVHDEREAKRPKVGGLQGGKGGSVSLPFPLHLELSETARHSSACSHLRNESSRSHLPTQRRA